MLFLFYRKEVGVGKFFGFFGRTERWRWLVFPQEGLPGLRQMFDQGHAEKYIYFVGGCPYIT